MSNTKVIAALEALLDAIKTSDCGSGVAKAAVAAEAVMKGNRTPPRKDYTGGNVLQDLVDFSRRAIRLSKTGTTLSKKERNLGRKIIKDVKKCHVIINTNGVDVFTHNRL